MRKTDVPLRQGGPQRHVCDAKTISFFFFLNLCHWDWATVKADGKWGLITSEILICPQKSIHHQREKAPNKGLYPRGKQNTHEK